MTRVLSVKKLSSERIDYYIQLIVDYYAGQTGENPHASWIGGAAELLKLAGQNVDPETVRNLLAGFDPKGESRLVQNAGKDARMPGFDLTFSAPKSYSYVWSIASPELRAKMEALFERAVERTFSKIESDLRIRIGKEKPGEQRKRVEAKGLGMGVTHHTARPADETTRPDAALHRHLLLFNTGFTVKGKSGALDGVRVLNSKAKVGRAEQFALKYGQEFRNELGRLTAKELGFDLRPTKIRSGTGWEIAGIPKSELGRNSKRSKQITEATPENATPGQRRAATIQTRQSKTEIEPSQLFPVWQKEAAARGITHETIEALRTAHTREIEREQARERARERGISR